MTEWPFDALFYVYLCIAKRIKAAIKRVKSRMKFELFRAEAGSSESSNSRGDANLVYKCRIKKVNKMKRRMLYVENYAEIEKVVARDMSGDFGIDRKAEGFMAQVEDEVSEELMDLLRWQLLGFCKEMQREMAEDILFFALGHVVHTTGCPSADYVLDCCYTLIAVEHGIKKEQIEEDDDY